MTLHQAITDTWKRFQDELFPSLQQQVGPLGDRHRRLVAVLDMVQLEALLPGRRCDTGRLPQDRRAIARAFLAKSVWDLATTRDLLDRLHCDIALRRLCGWHHPSEIPSEATFSRAFSEFAEGRLPECLHEALVKASYDDAVVGHISRDSTAIHGRERPAPKAKPKPKPAKRRRGRPRKGEEVVKEPTRLERQLNGGMTLERMLDDLPTRCDVGTKRNAKGHQVSWTGYKLHIDCADGDIPVSCILTSASVHDSQVAIPLARTSARRVISLYELMDSAYDSKEIREHATASGRVPIIDVNPRRDRDLKERLLLEARAQRAAGHVDHAAVRYRQRSSVERVNSALKDSFGGRHVRVRGPTKVGCHLMFGILALTVEQLMRIAA